MIPSNWGVVSLSGNKRKISIKMLCYYFTKNIFNVQVENMNLRQIESLVSAYLHCKDAEKILNNAGSFIYTEAACPLMDEPMEQIYAVLIDGQDDETADWIYDLLQKGEAKAIYDLLQEGADNGNDPR